MFVAVVTVCVQLLHCTHIFIETFYVVYCDNEISLPYYDQFLSIQSMLLSQPNIIRTNAYAAQLFHILEGCICLDMYGTALPYTGQLPMRVYDGTARKFTRQLELLG